MAERKIDYQTFQHQAHSGFVITAPSLSRLYVDAALSLTDQLCRLDRIESRDRKELRVTGDTREELMRGWLNLILGAFAQEKFLSHRIVFNTFDGKQIVATLWGETYQPVKHGHISEVKLVEAGQIEIGDKATPEPHFFAKVKLSK